MINNSKIVCVFVNYPKRSSLGKVPVSFRENCWKYLSHYETVQSHVSSFNILIFFFFFANGLNVSSGYVSAALLL